MNSLIKIGLFLLAVWLSGCSKSIYLKDAKINQAGIFEFNKNVYQNNVIEKSISDSLELKWTAETYGSFSGSSVITYDKYIFAADLGGRIFVFDDSTGKELGLEKYKGEIFTTPIIHNNSLIFIVNDYKEKYSTIYMFDFLKGESKREVKINGNCTNELLKLENGFVTLTEQGTLYHYDWEFNLVWSFEAKSFSYSDPFLYEDKIFFTTVDGNVFCINLKGKELFTRNLSDRFESSIKANNRLLFVGDHNGLFICYDYLQDEIIWEYQTTWAIKLAPILTGNTVILSNLSGEIISLNQISGELIWQLKIDGIFNSTPLVFKNIFVQPDLFKKILFIDIENGKIIKQLNYESRVVMSPTYYNGKIYIGIDRGKILAYKTFELSE